MATKKTSPNWSNQLEMPTQAAQVFLPQLESDVAAAAVALREGETADALRLFTIPKPSVPNTDTSKKGVIPPPKTGFKASPLDLHEYTSTCIFLFVTGARSASVPPQSPPSFALACKSVRNSTVRRTHKGGGCHISREIHRPHARSKAQGYSRGGRLLGEQSRRSDGQESQPLKREDHRILGLARSRQSRQGTHPSPPRRRKGRCAEVAPRSGRRNRQDVHMGPGDEIQHLTTGDGSQQRRAHPDNDMDCPSTGSAFITIALTSASVATPSTTHQPPGNAQDTSAFDPVTLNICQGIDSKNEPQHTNPLPPSVWVKEFHDLITNFMISVSRFGGPRS
ncbi:hypothetical protein M422DRAFT_783108 [Sphaerobolus stellatus SS14]|uniref:Uncharacterized protein n=1 Tax=Sphaerobolus stellatus (strain SS14) TaxID=990650 RepID=A0A0C9V7W7_SPHS4|nr:hypothetical protein M422DRAFT_783108 [Sphaerobolus stellatus SS14]